MHTHIYDSMSHCPHSNAKNRRQISSGNTGNFHKSKSIYCRLFAETNILLPGKCITYGTGTRFLKTPPFFFLACTMLMRGGCANRAPYFYTS